MKKVELWLKETSSPIRYTAISTYTKGPFYCILNDKGKVHKYPVTDIFRAIEDYNETKNYINP